MYGTGDWVIAPDGTLVDFAIISDTTGVATFTEAYEDVVTVSGAATTKINASVPGQVTVQASADVYGDGSVTATTGTSPSSGDGVKDYAFHQYGKNSLSRP